MQVLAATLVLASALLGASGALGARDQPNGLLTSIVEVVETTITDGFLPAHRASGVLLSSKWVLSTKKAADKPRFPSMKKRHVVVGRGAGGEGVNVDIARREERDGLMLLELEKEVAFDAATRPVNLPHRNTDNTGASASLAGWGDKKDNLHSSAVNVLTKEECAAKGVADGLLCSADEGTGACGGDEGSPLVQDLKNGVYKLVGIVTGAQDAKKCLTTNTYIDVAKYTEWILTTVYA